MRQRQCDLPTLAARQSRHSIGKVIPLSELDLKGLIHASDRLSSLQNFKASSVILLLLKNT